MKQNPTERSRRLWDELAPRYDRTMRLAERYWFAGARPWIGARARGDVLEVGVGTGANLPHYPADVHITGIDLSPGMLAVGQRRADALGVASDLREGDAQELPFAADSYDTVVCTLGLCAIPDDRAAIAEMHRVLRPGGRLLLLDHIASNWWPIWLGQRLIELVSVPAAGEHFTRRPLTVLREHGFDIVESERLRAGTVERIHATKRR